MKLLSVATETEWADDKDEKIRYARDAFIRELLLAENLVVLTGLGTSRCANGPTMTDLWDAVQKTTGDKFAEIVDKVQYKHDPSDKNIEALLTQCQISQAYMYRSEVEEFIRTAEDVIAEQCRFVSSTTALPHHTAFLRKVARRSTRQPRMKLFTTNYDLCFEVAASQTQFVVIDGFSHTYPQQFDGSYFSYDLVRRDNERETPDYIPNVFHLYKLHGSVDWERDENANVVIKNPRTKRPAIIYPRHSKFEISYEQPYLEMMSRFQMALRQPNTGVLVIGFGFNDRHIVQPLMAAVRSNISLRLMVVSPDLEAMTESPDRNKELFELKRLITDGDPRLALLNGKFEELVPVIPDLVSKTEAELHLERIQGQKLQSP